MATLCFRGSSELFGGSLLFLLNSFFFFRRSRCSIIRSASIRGFWIPWQANRAAFPLAFFFITSRLDER